MCKLALNAHYILTNFVGVVFEGKCSFKLPFSPSVDLKLSSNNITVQTQFASQQIC